MARDHHIAASLLGQFSAQTSGPLRERKIAVQRRAAEVYMTVAAKVGFANNLYATPDRPVPSVDGLWTEFEAKLPAAISMLERQEEISADVWLRVLVPHIASLFVRGEEFEDRYLQRFGRMRIAAQKDARRAGPTDHGFSFEDLMTKTNTNQSRAIELSRLLAPTATARWTINHFPAEFQSIQNDVGLAGTQDIETGDIGWIVPMSRRTSVSIFPRYRQKVLHWTGQRWIASFSHINRSLSEAKGFNRSIAAFADRFIVGPNETLVAAYKDDLSAAKNIPLLEAWPFSHDELVVNRDQWQRLVQLTCIDRPPDRFTESQDIRIERLILDNSCLHKGWNPKVGTINGQLRESGVQIEGDDLEVSLRDRSAFYPDEGPIRHRRRTSGS